MQITYKEEIDHYNITAERCDKNECILIKIQLTAWFSCGGTRRQDFPEYTMIQVTTSVEF